MSEPITNNGVHVGFQIALKSNNTSSRPLVEYLWQVWWLHIQ